MHRLVGYSGQIGDERRDLQSPCWDLREDSQHKPDISGTQLFHILLLQTYTSFYTEVLILSKLNEVIRHKIFISNFNRRTLSTKSLEFFYVLHNSLQKLFHNVNFSTSNKTMIIKDII